MNELKNEIIEEAAGMLEITADDLMTNAMTKYGFDPGSPRWMPKGAQLAEYINCLVLAIEYKKNEEGNWESTHTPVTLLSFNDFDPNTRTYLVSYQKEGEKKPTTSRMIPDGWSYNEDLDSQDLTRLVPFSIYHKMREEESFNASLPIIFEKKSNISVEDMKFYGNIRSKLDCEIALDYLVNLAAVIRLNNNAVVSFRASKIEFGNVVDQIFALNIFDQSGEYIHIPIDANDLKKSYPFIVDGVEIGSVKLVNLGK